MAEKKNYFGNKALLLSRISTQQQQLKEGFSPQQNDLRVFANDQGYTELVPIDTVESGFLDLNTKEGWNAIIEYLERDKDCRTVIATEINRIARDQSVLQEVKKYLLNNKIQLIIKDLHFWLLNPDGTKSFSADLLFAIYSSMAEWEMLDKKERQQRALREYRKKGYSIGGKELFGYDRVCDGKLGKKNTYKVNDEQKKQINDVFNWYAYGINGDLSSTSLRSIVDECKQRGYDKYLCSQRNLNKCLKEEAYIGRKVTQNKMKNPQYWNYKDKSAPKYIDANSYECIYEPLVDKELFELVQRRLSSKNSHNRLTSNNKLVDISHEHITLLSKIAVCPICGKFLTGDYRLKDGFKKHTYRCATSRRNINNCSYRKAPSMMSLDSAVWSFLKTKVTEINAKKNRLLASIDQDELNKRIRNLEGELSLIDDEYENAKWLYNHEVKRNRDKARADYEKSEKEIDKKKERIEKLISKNKHLLTELKERDTAKQREAELEKNILKITSDKSEISKYIHLLVKTVKPLLATRSYTALEVVTFDNTDEVLDYNKEDSKGLPVIKAEKHDNIYFICLDKRDNNRIKARLITSRMAFWNVEGEYFYVSGDDRHYTVEDIFNLNLNEEDPTKYYSLRMGIEELDYIPLNVYDNDMSHQKISNEELEKMAGEALE